MSPSGRPLLAFAPVASAPPRGKFHDRPVPPPPYPQPPQYQEPQQYQEQQPPAFGPPPAFGQPAPYGYAQLGAPQPRRANPAAGAAVGLGAMLASAALYGFIMKATNSQWSYFAVALALIVSFGLGKVGGRHPVLPVLGLLLSLLGVFLGQLFFIYLVLHQQYGLGPGDVFGAELGDTMQGWRSMLDFRDVFFYLVAGVEGFVFTKRFAA
ncbi:hypothetical protein OG455_23965 [Kitasatospora sp. NBC_01287]|uniref:hypothetical protein n=1 Tax=Kitasatospora sp. NBC_01287 TaxID=2903573 RepID=UPI002252D7CC|nr:hypothetical protein [Kitasatospora sp. NBC_01287]MCX4748535.1 hypothetical protein [Kitasatospora sp. NBC_01287]